MVEMERTRSREVMFRSVADGDKGSALYFSLCLPLMPGLVNACSLFSRMIGAGIHLAVNIFSVVFAPIPKWFG